MPLHSNTQGSVLPLPFLHLSPGWTDRASQVVQTTTQRARGESFSQGPPKIV